ncbi:unnamed protein product [Brassica oleracea var. botrytis]
MCVGGMTASEPFFSADLLFFCPKTYAYIASISCTVKCFIVC